VLLAKVKYVGPEILFQKLNMQTVLQTWASKDHHTNVAIY
jgi:hypothetical protein